jgi:HEPN domain-containing protein
LAWTIEYDYRALRDLKKLDRATMEASLAALALDAACFHAQQMCEKSLKGFLAHHGVAFPFTHNLTKLVEMAAAIDPGFRSLLSTVAPLTPYAVELRYDDSFWPSRPVAEEARSSALAVLQFVLDRLPAETRKAAQP